jgi:hypothetical protein
MSDIVGKLEQLNRRYIRKPECKAVLDQAVAEISRFRQSDAEVICRILANTPPEEWLSKASIHEALKAWRIK